ncbi:MAG: hypothetical protein K2X93_14085, partial [Candidatus Obscuribacterales bacterium]|nr:hypothetical protein [Candidatus Obscuribacterales bacterium]
TSDKIVHGVSGKTVLACWDSEPSAFSSGLVFVTDVAHLGEAYNRAIDRGLLQGTKVDLTKCIFPPVKEAQM